MKSLWRIYYWTKTGRRTTVGRAYSFSLFYGKKKFFDREIFPFKRKADKELFIESILFDLETERVKQNKRRAQMRRRKQEIERLKKEERERELALQREIARRKKVKKKAKKKLKKKKVKKKVKKIKRVVSKDDIVVVEEIIDEFKTKEIDISLLDELYPDELELMEKVMDPISSEEIKEVKEEPKILTISKDEKIKTKKVVRKMETYSSSYDKEYIDKKIMSKTLGLLDATILNFTLTDPLRIDYSTNKEYVKEVLKDQFTPHLTDFFEKFNGPGARYIFRTKYEEIHSDRRGDYSYSKGFGRVRTPKNLSLPLFLNEVEVSLDEFSFDTVGSYIIHSGSEYFLITGFTLEVIYV